LTPLSEQLSKQQPALASAGDAATDQQAR